MSAAQVTANEPLITYTLFPDVTPHEKTERADVPWHELVGRIERAPTYLRKGDCPLISIAEYGELKSDKDCLRHAANVKRIFGVEIDYDGEAMPIEEAANILHGAGILACLYTSPSHRPDKPRWRVLLPLSEPSMPAQRASFVGRVNRLLGGVATRESFTLSQSFYLGRVKDAEYIVLGTEGVCVDLAGDIEPLYYASHGNGSASPRDPTTDAQLRARFVDGTGRYEAMLSLSARWAARGMSAEDIETSLAALLDLGNTSQNADGIDLHTRCRPMAQSAFKKFGETRPPPKEVPRETQDKELKRGKPRTTPNGAPRKGRNLNDVPFVAWETLGLSRKGNDGAGPPHAHLANAQRVLAMHPDLVGNIWYDEFHDRVFQTLFQDEPAEWSDYHDTRLTVWMIDKMRISEMAVVTVQRAVDDFARFVVRNEPMEWMQSLTWDGIERLPSFMSDGFGAVQNDYTAAVGRCFMVGMVARVFRPGCQVDYMPVFEGKQGIRKSSALHAIGGKWFSEVHEDVTKKDFFQCLQGRMLVEFSELHAFRRQEVERIKGIITCRMDRYRDSYGRRAVDHARKCVFSGTTNRDDWVQDDTGARRFWPITCGEINLDYIVANREQIFAEAVARYARAESWWDIDPELAMHEQNARRDGDAWADYILPWAATKPHVTVGEVLTTCLQIPPDKQDKSSQMRVASVLRVAKWSRKDVWNGIKNVKKWVNPSNGGEVAQSGLGF